MYQQLMPFTLFLDILGFGNHVGKITNEQEAEDFITFMESNKGIFNIVSEASSNFVFSDWYEFKFTFISDSIVVSYYPKKLYISVDESTYYEYSSMLFFSICNKLIPLFYNMWSQKKVFLRGGISNKFSYIKNEFAVGEGLIEAYNLESKIAKYPRIVLSDDLSKDKKFLSHIKNICVKHYKSRKYILEKDKEADIFFINYLKLVLNQEAPHLIDHLKIKASNRKIFNLHKTTILEMQKSLKQETDSNRIEKLTKSYNWIKSYHNIHVPKEFRITD
jgi:hypothetical protein